MNTVNLGLGALPMLIAAAVLTYGLWVGQRALAFRAMWWVLGATVLASLLSLQLLRLPGLITFFVGGFSLSGLLLSVLTTALSFLPFLVAALQVGAIREATRPA
jgi:hypothetical protein